MDTKQYLQMLYAHRVLIAVTVVVCTAAAGAYAWTREPLYAAHTQLFVSTQAKLVRPEPIRGLPGRPGRTVARPVLCGDPLQPSCGRGRGPETGTVRERGGR